jgi:hypothetical protein
LGKTHRNRLPTVLLIRESRVSDLAGIIEGIGHALTAVVIGNLLAIGRMALYKMTNA